MALSTFRATDRIENKEIVDGYLATGVLAYAGGIACIDTSTGYTVQGQTKLGLIPYGVFESTVDNTSNGFNTAGYPVRIRVGTFGLANSTAGDAITYASRGQICYIVDDQTVALTDGSGTRSPAGVIYDVPLSGQPGYGTVQVTLKSSNGTSRALIDGTNVAPTTGTGIGKVKITLVIPVVDGAGTTNTDTVLDATYGKILITAARFVKTGSTGGASDTVQLANGATTNYITDALALSTKAANVVTEAAQVIQTYNTVNAGATLRSVNVHSTTSVAGVWYIDGVRV